MSSTDQLVLIVDDSPTNIRLLADLVGGEYDVKIAKNGRSALEIASTPPHPDLILLDIMMPELNGYDTCRMIKEQPDTQNIPVIFITAKTDKDDIIKGFEVGGIDYITKPFNKDELMARVRTHAELKALNDELEHRVAEEIHKRLSQNMTFKQMFDSLPSSVSLIDRDFKYQAVNKTFESYRNATGKNIIGEHITATMSQERFQNIEPTLRHVLTGITEIYKEEINLPNGSIKYYETAFSPFYDSSQEVTGIIINSADVTENRLLEKEIKEKEQKLIQQKRFADMGQLMSAIAHQWRQPLNNIYLISQMLQEMDDGAEYGYGREDLYAQQAELISFMSKTIDDFSRYFSASVEKDIFSLTDELKESISLMEAQFAADNIETQLISNTQEEKAEFFGSSGVFRQIIMNILANARDAILDWQKTHSEDKGMIYITLTESGSLFDITIENTGSPIPEDILHQIFNPYFTTKDEGKGVGIGLYMSRSVLEKDMKGKISAENTSKGVAFHIELRK